MRCTDAQREQCRSSIIQALDKQALDKILTFDWEDVERSLKDSFVNHEDLKPHLKRFHDKFASKFKDRTCMRPAELYQNAIILMFEEYFAARVTDAVFAEEIDGRLKIKGKVRHL